MNTTDKTIRMPKELLDKWLAALRSGEYTQGRGRLQTEAGYCCLGVLQHVVDARVETVYDDRSDVVPSASWKAQNNVVFRDKAGRNETTPYLPTIKMFASEANDEGKSFAEIADAIEACAEGY